MESYTDGSSSHVLTTEKDGLVEGKIYTLRWYAVNSKGASIPSDEILVALANSPQHPALVEKVTELSSPSSITVQWSEVNPGLSPAGDILGYKLRVKNPATSEEWIAFDGQLLGLPDQTLFTLYDLQSGSDYLFSVLAINFNGDGQESTPISFNVCLAPAQASAPKRVTSTRSSITIEWQTPSSDNGCPITGYAVYADDGSNGAFIEVNQDNDP